MITTVALCNLLLRFLCMWCLGRNRCGRIVSPGHGIHNHKIFEGASKSRELATFASDQIVFG